FLTGYKLHPSSGNREVDNFRDALKSLFFPQNIDIKIIRNNGQVRFLVGNISRRSGRFSCLAISQRKKIEFQLIGQIQHPPPAV
ncbi:MAG: hypothetical protein VX535_07520, partial [Pseudomonadota bacterium]|nr:hypothetical protein [Pseudomonadota bacterium]